MTERDEGSSGAHAFAHNSAVLFAAQVIGNAGYFAAVLVLARGLGPAGRGAIAFFIVTATVAARVAGLGVKEATMVFAAQRPRLRPVLLTNLLVAGAASGLFVALIVCGGLVLLSSIRPAGVGGTEVVFLGVGIVVMVLVDGGYGFLLGCSRFGVQALVTAGSSWVYAGALVLVWAAGGLTVTRAAVTWAAAQLVRALFVLRASVGAARPGPPRAELLREAILYGGRAWVGSLARFANFRADQLLMGFIASEASLGVYAVAVNASEILLYLPEATAMALLPLVAQLDVTEQADRTLQAFRSLATITAGGIVAAIVLGVPLLPIVFGSGFTASQDPFLLLLPGAIGYVALGVFSSALVASAPGLSSVGPLVSLVVGIALDLVLIPAYGASGAGAAASAAFLAGGVASLVIHQRRTSFRLRSLFVFQRGDLELLKALLFLPFRLRRRAKAADDAAVLGGRP